MSNEDDPHYGLVEQIIETEDHTHPAVKQLYKYLTHQHRTFKDGLSINDESTINQVIGMVVSKCESLGIKVRQIKVDSDGIDINIIAGEEELNIQA